MIFYIKNHAKHLNTYVNTGAKQCKLSAALFIDFSEDLPICCVRLQLSHAYYFLKVKEI